MKNICINTIASLLILMVSSLSLIGATAGDVSAEMKKMSDDEMSEVVGQSSKIATVKRKARQMNLFKKLAKSPSLKQKIKKKTKERMAEKVAGKELADNKLIDHYMDAFLNNAVESFGSGQTPVSVSQQGNIQISEEMSEMIFKTALEQSFSMFSNPERVFDN